MGTAARDVRLVAPRLRPTWLEIDLDALAANVQALRRRIGQDRLLYAVVKANAYGHGAQIVGPAALAAGADRLAVAALNEALELRQSGVRAPILILGYTPPEQANLLIEHDITATVFDVETALALSRAGAKAERRLTVHVKVDTGMHRLGVACEQAVDLCRRLADTDHLRVEGIFTHFSSADEREPTYTKIQLHRFVTLLDELERVGCRPPIAHAANSAATLTLPASHLDGVRCGIVLYGLDPSSEVPAPDDMRPVLRWKARIAQVRRLAPGEPVSYNNTWRAPDERTVAVVPVGYADGFPRAPHTWGHVLLHGWPVPIVGRVCMDQTIIDVTEIVHQGHAVAQGDEVVLIGKQQGAELSAETVATRLGTNNYDVVSRLMARLPRIPVHGGMTR